MVVFTCHLALKLTAFVSSQWFSFLLQLCLYIIRSKWKWYIFSSVSEIDFSSASKSFCCYFYHDQYAVFRPLFHIFLLIFVFQFFSVFFFFLSVRAFVKFTKLMFDMALHVAHACTASSCKINNLDWFSLGYSLKILQSIIPQRI